MKVTLTLAAAIMTPQGPVRETMAHEDIVDVQRGPEWVVLKTKNDLEIAYNRNTLLSVVVDPYGSIAKPGQSLLTQ